MSYDETFAGPCTLTLEGRTTLKNEGRFACNMSSHGGLEQDAQDGVMDWPGVRLESELSRLTIYDLMTNYLLIEPRTRQRTFSRSTAQLPMHFKDEAQNGCQ